MNFLKICSSIILFTVSCNFLSSQKNSDRIEKRLSMYLVTENLFEKSSESYSFGDENRGLDIFFDFNRRVELGGSYLRITKSNSYYRIGLNSLIIGESRNSTIIERTAFIQQPIDGGNESFSRISTEFEYGKYFRYNKFRMGTGIFIRLKYQFFKIAPELSLLFPATINELSTELGLSHFIEYEIIDRLFIFTQMPINVGQSTFIQSNIESPFLAERGINRENDIKFKLKVGLRIGFMANF